MNLYFYRETKKGEEFCIISNSEQNNNENLWISEIKLFDNLKINFNKLFIIGNFNNKNNLSNSNFIFDIEILKSNLQKAIRKKLLDVSLSTAYTILVQDKTQLLRRLPIIALEDSTINFQDFTYLIWLMVADSKGYKLTNYDINRILSIVEFITLNDYRDYINNDTESDYLPFDNYSEFDKDFISFYNSIFIRLEFGTMEGDIKWLKNIANEWYKRINKKDGDINYYLKKIPKAEVKEYNFKELEFRKKYQIPEAIDFHCYKNIFNDLKEKIPNLYETRENLTKTIWYLRSSLNLRNNFIRENKKAEEFVKKYENERIKYSKIYSLLEDNLNIISDDIWKKSIRKKKNTLLNFINE